MFTENQFSSGSFKEQQIFNKCDRNKLAIQRGISVENMKLDVEYKAELATFSTVNCYKYCLSTYQEYCIARLLQ